MKTNKRTSIKSKLGLAAALGSLLVGTQAFSQTPLLWEVYEDTWSIGRNTAQTGNQTQQNVADTATNDQLFLSQFSGDRELARVVIRYFRTTNFTLDGTLSYPSGGSNNFTTGGQETDTILGELGTLDADLAAVGDGITPDTDRIYNETDTDTNFDLDTTDSPDDIPNDRTFQTVSSFDEVIFDSDSGLNAIAFTNAELNTIFTGAGDFNFQVDSRVIFDYERDSNTNDIQLTTLGTDAGTIRIEYYVIPEVGTLAMMAVALGSFGGITLLRRRKRA